MVYKSFEKLLGKFPYFLNKNKDSNFSKSETVFNEEFKEIYNNLYDVYLESKLNKHVLIWKEQEAPYEYDMCFHVSLPDLKSVKITRHYWTTIIQETIGDDGSVQKVETRQEMHEDIYTETYEYDEHINKFEYLHSSFAETIIPKDKYTISVETWDEYTTIKGFPENNTIENNEYDHDTSLDHFGNIFKFPRRTYQQVEPEDYPNTVPAYDNQLTEDDYHYLQRLLYYASHLQDTPLPVLEIFKLFSLTDVQLLNRSRLICRMIDTSRHQKEGVYNRDWRELRWEHKDGWCNGNEEDLFLFATVNNNNLLEGQKFNFTFQILNSLGEQANNTKNYNLITESIIDESEKPWVIVPYKDNQLFQDGLYLYSDKKWVLTTNDINNEDCTFIFKCFSSIEDAQDDINTNNGNFIIHDTDIVSDEIYITVRGCNSADWYVSATDGDDSNTGTSKTDAFKTIHQALQHIEGEKNIISVLDGVYSLPEAETITENTTIVSCPDYNPRIQCNYPVFFRVGQNVSLTLKNIRLNYKCCSLYSSFTVFKNNNNLNYPLNVRVAGKFCLISTGIVLDTPLTDEWVVLHNYQIKGCLVKSDGESPDEYTTYYKGNSCVEEDTLNINKSKNSLTGEKVKLLKNDTVVSEATVDENGVFSFTVNSGVDVGSANYQVVYNESEVFCNSTSENITMNVVKTTPEVILETYVFYIGVNERLHIPFKVKVDTDTKITGEQLYVTLENDAGVIDEAVIAFESDNTATGKFTFTSATVGTNNLKIKVQGNVYINTVDENIQVIVEKITRELVDGATTLNDGFYFVETLPEDLTQYNTDDMIVTLDNTGENTLYITDTEEDTPTNLTDDDEVWIDSTSELQQLIRDKKTEE